MRKHDRMDQEEEFRQAKLNETREFLNNLESLSDRIAVVLVDPKYQGNIGAVARSMMNAGLRTLYIVGDTEIEKDAFIRAVYGVPILENSTRINNLDEITEKYHIVAATSSETTFNERKFRRIPVSAENFWKDLIPTDRKIALVFGREDDGLRNTEVEQCNYFIHIPSSPDFPAYNLSHAVTIVLYEMIKLASGPIGSHEMGATESSLKLLETELENVLEMSNYSSYRRRNTMVMLRRIIARSNLSDNEYHKLRGILDSVQRTMKHNASENKPDQKAGKQDTKS